MPREKIALVVFVGLIAVSLCGLFGYLTLGHSWNVAASNIDDATGRMDGYTAIVYEGTAVPELAEQKAVKEPGGPQGAASGSQGSGAVGRTEDGAEAKPSGTEDVVDAEGKEHGSVESGLVRDADSGEGADEAGGKNPAAGLPSETPGTFEQEQGSASGALSDAASSADGPLEDEVPVDIGEIEQSYLDKNATVFVIDSENLELYREGTILKKGDHRFGIFSVSSKTPVKTVNAQVEYFQSHDVDFIVALTPDKEIVEDASGVDIVISTQDEGLFVMGETIDGTFYVNAPQIGSAGVILISPSNVVSAKVVQPS